jgi:hypothetical protein
MNGLNMNIEIAEDTRVQTIGFHAVRQISLDLLGCLITLSRSASQSSCALKPWAHIVESRHVCGTPEFINFQIKEIFILIIRVLRIPSAYMFWGAMSQIYVGEEFLEDVRQLELNKKK